MQLLHLFLLHVTKRYTSFSCSDIHAEIFTWNIRILWVLQCASVCMYVRIYLYTGWGENIETPKNLKKYKFYRKMFQIKVIRFKKIYSILSSVWPWLASWGQIKVILNFFNGTPSIYIYIYIHLQGVWKLYLYIYIWHQFMAPPSWTDRN